MQHILHDIHDELHRTHKLLDSYRIQGFSEWKNHIFGKSFKKLLFIYVHKKEEVLILYSSLYNDFQKEIQNSTAKESDIKLIQKDLEIFIQEIITCGDTLENMIAYSKNQEEILREEKIFFYQLLQSIHSDLLEWTEKMREDIFEKKEKNILGKNIFETGKNILLEKKKELEKFFHNFPEKR